MKPRILLIEDEKIMRVTLEDALRDAGYEVRAFDRGLDGVDAFRHDAFTAVVSDIRLPDVSGQQVLADIRGEDPSAVVILMTAYGTINDAVRAMKQGAFDYITKPFSLDEFKLTLKRAVEYRGLREENIRLHKALSTTSGYANMVGESEAMQRVFEMIGRAAQTDATVLVTGESGTGKELVASALHYQSARGTAPFIRVNCGALPDNLIESELFGHERGAFTGAAKRKPGRFELADGGTIFLDEIGELPTATQVKLLRVLQDGRFERLGGTTSISVDVRVIAATNRRLEDEVREGRFREDLYYRLHVVPIDVPPLRERATDIPLLVDCFLKRCNDRFHKTVQFRPEAVLALMDYPFPGNVRELENIVERCVTMAATPVIDVSDLPLRRHGEAVSDEAGEPVDARLSKVTAEAERAHILRVLKTTGGNRTRAAEILGISRKTLWEKMNTFNIR